MNGRYAFTQDSAERCLEGIKALAAVLDALQRPPAVVTSLPDRNSEVLGAAAAKALGISHQRWDGDAAGLVVAYDLGD